jgi:hypothetical protein
MHDVPTMYKAPSSGTSARAAVERVALPGSSGSANAGLPGVRVDHVAWPLAAQKAEGLVGG